MGPTETAGRLVDGQALEVAEHDWQPESARQALDLFVQQFGLFAGQERLLGGWVGDIWDCVQHRGRFLVAALAIAPGVPGRAQRNAVEPVAQHIGVADGVRLLGQNQEDGLEGVFGVVTIMQKVGADAEDHWPVAQDECRERGLADGVAPHDEAIEELPVGHAGDRAAVEEGADLPDHRAGCQRCHGRWLSRSDAVWFLPHTGYWLALSYRIPSAGRIRDGTDRNRVNARSSSTRSEGEIRQFDRVAGFGFEVAVAQPVCRSGDQRDVGDAAVGIGA